MQWLDLVSTTRLGACLADDMGLGKTIQILSLLLVLKNEAEDTRKPCLLVAPASLLANWAAEIARSAPSLKAIVVLYPSAAPAETRTTDDADNLADVDLVITSYGFLARAPWLGTTPWRLVVLDEAQAIKNPAADQTKTVKQLRADTRIALTGTPIENRLKRPVVDSSTSSIPGSWDRRRNFRPSSNASPTCRITLMARCATWCAPTSCGA